MRSPARRAWAIALVVLSSGLLACGPAIPTGPGSVATVESGRPTGGPPTGSSAATQPGPTETPPPDLAELPAGLPIVVDQATPIGAPASKVVVISAIARSGDRIELARLDLADIPGGPLDWSGGERAGRLGPDGRLWLAGEVSSGNDRGPALAVVPIGQPADETWLIRGTESAAWSPDGRLVLVDRRVSPPLASIADPAMRAIVPLAFAAGIEPETLWAADGAAVVARRFSDRGSQVGRLGLSGAFTAGIGEVFDPLGVDGLGHDGARLGVGSSDGPAGSDTVLVEDSGLDVPDNEVTWFQFTDPGVGPRFHGYAWDRAGGGVWIVLDDRRGGWQLAHLDRPGGPSTVAELPVEMTAGLQDAAILGISPDQATVVLGTQDDSGRQLVGVDVVTRLVTDLGPGWIVGWSGGS